MRIFGFVWASFAGVSPGLAASTVDSLAAGFERVPVENRPWCYWWWLNGHVDRETISGDLESMRRLGFGGLLMFDSRGYWEDDDHLRLARPEIDFAGSDWQDHVAFAVREARRLGLEFTLNISSSGGKLDGPWPVGADAPKQLMVCETPLEPDTRAAIDMTLPDMPHYHDLAVFAVRHGDNATESGWRPVLREDETVRSLEECRDLTGFVRGRAAVEWDVPAEGRWSAVRFGWRTMPGHERDVDMLDEQAVTRHWHRVMDPLRARVGDLFGKTLTHVYSVSWEGAFPTWATAFEEGFRMIAGYEIRPYLPYLAGFDFARLRTTDLGGREKVVRDFYRVRNELFLTKFYGTVRSLAHESGLKLYSESGGPWNRRPDRFLYADQLRYYAVNDMPQGEFWYREAGCPSPLPGVRGAVSAAHVYGFRRVSAEAFTHMMQHWSTVPAGLKRCGDDAFVDGINHFVWHTFTCSPAKFGVPGHEYFAGTHINRNVTWHRELGPFVTYLGRCQWMLQQGLPVSDLAVWAGETPYQGWDRHRDRPCEGSSIVLPRAATYDLVDTAALLTRASARGGRLSFPDGMSYDALALDPPAGTDVSAAVVEKARQLEQAGVRVVRGGDAAAWFASRRPDFDAPEPFLATHRRTSDEDIYFVTGEGSCEAVFRADRPAAEQWNPVTGERCRLRPVRTADGRQAVRLSLPHSGSTFVIFRECSSLPFAPETVVGRRLVISGPWRASFAYHAGVRAAPPASRELPLGDFSRHADPEVAHFAGTVSYRTSFELSEGTSPPQVLSLGSVVGGLVRVFVNGSDLGILWTAPWEVQMPNAVLQKGSNDVEIRFVNAWANRLIGDCALPPERRVSKSNLAYRKAARKDGIPPECSGYVSEEPLFPNGLIGPVECVWRELGGDTCDVRK